MPFGPGGGGGGGGGGAVTFTAVDSVLLDAVSSFTITLASLAAGAARQSTFVANTNNRPYFLGAIKIRSGAVAPVAGETYEVFLLRGNGSGYRTDGAGAADAAITIENAELLATIVVTATANKDFFVDFDTRAVGILGTELAIAVRNSTSQALNATEANHTKQYQTYTDQAIAA
jgi:hypothetical protein